MTASRQFRMRGLGSARKRRALGVVASLALMASVWAPAPAHAATPPSLSGEGLSIFYGSAISGSLLTASCADPSTTTSFAYDLPIAADPSSAELVYGPYPGTFTTSGTVVIGPQNLGSVGLTPNPAPFTGFFTGSRDEPTGPLISVVTAFEIDSPAGHVVGTETLLPPVSSTDGWGACRDLAGTVGPTGPIADGTIRNAAATLSYQATITTPAGVFQDHGTSTYLFEEYKSPSSFGGGGDFRFNFDSAVPAPATQVTLTPPDAINTVGTSDTVTATATDAASAPVPGATVLFTVSGSSSAGGSCSTDANGQCSFTYAGPQLPGADIITGCADVNTDGSASAGEPCAEATAAWILPTSTAGQTTGGGQTLNAAGNDKIAFGYNARSSADGLQGNCTVVDPSPATNVRIKCLDVTSLVQTATHATFFGNAQVNGAATTYRIDVDDLGEPGAGLDTFKIVTSSGYAVGGTLTNGNIQVHS